MKRSGKSGAKEAFRKLKPKTVSWWKNKAWHVFSKWIQQRDGYMCITCGKAGSGSFMHAGHYITRRCNNTMFDERNAHAQCMNCNLWGYGNMGTYTLKMIEMYGPGIIKELTEKSKVIHQFTIQELQDIIKRYG